MQLSCLDLGHLSYPIHPSDCLVVQAMRQFMRDEMGYQKIQGTKKSAVIPCVDHLIMYVPDLCCGAGDAAVHAQ
jgi:hypothetical protein